MWVLLRACPDSSSHEARYPPLLRACQTVCGNCGKRHRVWRILRKGRYASAWRVRGGSRLRGQAWSSSRPMLHGGGTLGAAKGLPQADFHIWLWRTASTPAQGACTIGAVIYLIFIYKASFSFYLNKFSLKGDFYYCHKWKISIACHP